jgi:hypothetical protein
MGTSVIGSALTVMGERATSDGAIEWVSRALCNIVARDEGMRMTLNTAELKASICKMSDAAKAESTRLWTVKAKRSLETKVEKSSGGGCCAVM